VELQSRQAELQETNEQLASKAKLLAEQNAEVERKSAEVEQARRALEEKAEELALTSKYKSEFLANMSHELRTPLNSILILSQQLAGNPGGNLTPKQIEFSRNINSSGSDLLNLINDILDLSKIESGTVTVEVEPISFGGVLDNLNRSFRHVAEAKNLPFRIEAAPDLPRTIDTDSKRLQQILKNLLSNAVKFTTQGHVELRVGLAAPAGRPTIRCCATPRRWCRSPSRTPASASRPRSSASSSRRSSRPTPARRASTAAPASASRSAASWPRCSAARSGWPACRARAAPSRSTCRCTTPAPTASRRSRARRRGDLARRAAARARGAGGRRSRRAQGRRADRAHHRGRPAYARVLLAWRATRGFKGIVTSKGTWVSRVARQFRPSAITLDIFLPDMLGWTVLTTQARSRHAPHPRADHHAEEGTATGCRTALSRAWSRRPRPMGLEAAFNRIVNFTRRGPSGCWSSRTTTSSASRSCSSWATRTSRRWPCPPGTMRWSHEERAVDCVVLDLRCRT
jgi:hypothetical protein